MKQGLFWTSGVVLALLLLGSLGGVLLAQREAPANALPAPFVFATAGQAADVLKTSDAFTRHMSPFDRAVRLKSDQPSTEADYLAFAATQTLEWTDEEKEKVITDLLAFASELNQLQVIWPEHILIAKTTGKEDASTFYTRQNMLVIPQKGLKSRSITRVLAHEIFHVLSRANPEKRDAWYATIGYQPAGTNLFPRVWQQHHLSNPDSPGVHHSIRVKLNGQPTWIAPVIVSHHKTFDPEKNWGIFRYLSVRWIVLEGQSGPAKLSNGGDEPVIVSLDEVTNFFEQVGRNTGYLMHPEETIADHFAMIVTRKEGATSPNVLHSFKELLYAP